MRDFARQSAEPLSLKCQVREEARFPSSSADTLIRKRSEVQVLAGPPRSVAKFEQIEQPGGTTGGLRSRAGTTSRTVTEGPDPGKLGRHGRARNRPGYRRPGRQLHHHRCRPHSTRPGIWAVTGQRDSSTLRELHGQPDGLRRAAGRSRGYPVLRRRGRGAGRHDAASPLLSPRTVAMVQARWCASPPSSFHTAKDGACC